jgi:SulP family sulfate permease
MTAKQRIARALPIANWLPSYNKTFLSGDLSAGLTVGVMLIPQGMAYAMLAGLPPIHGLYAVTIPLLVYAILGTSRQLAVGPVAMVSLLAAAGIGALEPQTTADYLTYAFTLAFLVGIIQLGMGILRMGFVVNFLSHPVLSGFTSAAAIIIGLSQIKHLFKIDLPRSEHAHEILWAMAHNIKDVHWLTFALGVAGIIIIKYGKKIHARFPAPLAAVVLGIVAVTVFGLDERGVVVLGEVPSGLPGLSMPSFDGSAWSQLFPVALAISLVGFAESFAVAKAIQQRHKDYELRPNQELIGLGAANIGAAFFQGYPVTGGFSRTAVNDQAGAKTGMASIISAALIVLTLLFLTGLFVNLPSAILAAVVLVAVSGLIDVKEPISLWKRDRTDFAMLLVTFLATLTLGIEAGIIIGMVLSLVAVIYRASRPHMARMGRIPGTKTYRNIDRFNDLEIDEHRLVVRIDGALYFANTEYIRSTMMRWMDGKPISEIVFDLSTVPHIDSSAAHTMHSWIAEWHQQGINIKLSGTHGPVRDILKTWDIVAQVGENQCYLSVDDAIEEMHDPTHQAYVLETR